MRWKNLSAATSTKLSSLKVENENYKAQVASLEASVENLLKRNAAVKNRNAQLSRQLDLLQVQSQIEEKKEQRKESLKRWIVGYPPRLWSTRARASR